MTLVGAMGCAAEAGAKLERQPATELSRFTTRSDTSAGTRTDLPVTVDIDPDDDLIDAIATGRQTAAVVIMFLILVSGVFLLLRGIGRRRRSRLV